MQQRIITGVFAGVLFIGVLLLGGYWFAGLILLMALIGMNEYLRMIGMNKEWITRLLAMAGLLAWLSPLFGLFTDGFSISLFVWLSLFVLLAVTVFTKNRITIDHAALVFLGILYLGFGFAAMIETRNLGHGLFWTLFIFLCIWATDSGAYFSGRFLGKHKLWPAISPNKTIEGAIGGIVISVIVALIFHFGYPDLVSAGRAAALGVLIGVVGQLGDLIQSAYKRVKGIKDTGSILPGHGGVLDRMDSWLIVFPFLQLLSLIPQT